MEVTGLLTTKEFVVKESSGEKQVGVLLLALYLLELRSHKAIDGVRTRNLQILNEVAEALTTG